MAMTPEGGTTLQCIGCGRGAQPYRGEHSLHPTTLEHEYDRDDGGGGNMDHLRPSGKWAVSKDRVSFHVAWRKDSALS